MKSFNLPELPGPEVAQHKAMHDEAAKDLAHDALHCSFCTHDRKMQQIAMTGVGIAQASLQVQKETNGVPRGTVFSFKQTSPAQNTNYISPAVGMDGVVRNLAITGSGNVTITQTSQHILGGSLVIGTFNTPFQLAHHFIVPVDSTFTISTDSASAAFIGISVWVEPAHMTDTDFYRMRR